MMNYSKLIHDYLDEGLDGSLEDMLFEKLAASPEARLDFNQQMKIHLLSRADMGNIAPPAAITSAVFANLGFAIPAPSNAALPQNRFAAFFKRYGISILAGIVGLMIVGAGFKYLSSSYSNSGSMASNNSTNSRNNIELSNQTPGNNSQIAVVSSLNSDAANSTGVNGSNPTIENRNSQNNQSAYRRYGSGLVNHNNEGKFDNPQNSTAKPTDEEINDGNTSKSDRGYQLLTSDSRDLAKLNNPGSLGSLGNHRNSGLNGSMKSSTFTGFPDFGKPEITNWIVTAYYIGTKDVNGDFRDVAGISNSQSDFSIGGFYKISDDWYLGAQFGKERFNQDFFTDGGRNHFRQSPQLWFYGASMMYLWHDAFSVPNIIYPYGSFFAGSNSVGFLSKLQAGISWGFLSYADMNFGAEYSLSIYPSDGSMFGGNLYYTQKFGIVAGIGVEF